MTNKHDFQTHGRVEKNSTSYIRSQRLVLSNLSEGDNQLINRLKQLRLDISKKQGLPAYTVFHDSTLIQMVEYKPKSEEDFLRIDGVGLTKYQKYGKRFLEEIELFLNED